MDKKTNFFKFNISTIFGFLWFMLFFKTSEWISNLIPDESMAEGIIAGLIVFIIGIISAFFINKRKQGFITGFLLTFTLGIVYLFYNSKF